MKAVILAGGLGSRLSEETDRVPKPLVQIGGQPILWHIMKIYEHYGVNDFVVCLGYKGYLIKEYFKNFWLHQSDVTIDVKTGDVQVHRRAHTDWKITLVETGLNTATAGRLRRIRDFVNAEPFHMTYGDGLSDVNLDQLVKFHQSHGKAATVTAIRPPGRFGALKVSDSRVEEVREKSDEGESLINGGFFVLEPRVFEFIPSDDKIPWERQPMTDLVQAHQLMAYEHKGFWQPMDTLREKNALEELWSRGTAPWKTWQD